MKHEHVSFIKLLFRQTQQFCILVGGLFCRAGFHLGNFQQHITCSTATGIAVGGIAYHFGFPPPVCLVSASLCSFAGMLPDVDSDTSKSFQECIYLTAGIGCVLTASRLRHYGVDHDLVVLGGVFIFLLIRFGLGTLIKKLTTHRGMMHSIPMAILCGELLFFVVTGTVAERLVKAAALTAGFLSHLILDEVYSIDSTGKTLRLKKSFGTALKWYNPKKQGAATIIYTLVFLLGLIACTNPEVIEVLNGNAVMAKQSAECPIRLEAAEFLSQRDAEPTEVPLALELPPAMHIGSDWNPNTPIQPARIQLW